MSEGHPRSRVGLVQRVLHLQTGISITLVFSAKGRELLASRTIVSYVCVVLDFWGEGEDLGAVRQRGDCRRPIFTYSLHAKPMRKRLVGLVLFVVFLFEPEPATTAVFSLWRAGGVSPRVRIRAKSLVLCPGHRHGGLTPPARQTHTLQTARPPSPLARG